MLIYSMYIVAILHHGYRCQQRDAYFR